MKKTQPKNIYDELLSMIISGDYVVGDKFFTEMQLCSKFNLSRSTIREAMSKLQAKGFVDVIKGSGTYIKSTDLNTTANTLIIDKIDNIYDFMEIRENIESLAVKLFIRNYSEDNIERLIKTSIEIAKISNISRKEINDIISILWEDNDE